MKTAVFGSGYVGLVAGACLARLGHRITLIDVDRQKIETINNGASPIYEEGLDELLGAISIEAGSDYGLADGAEIFLICVGTPANPDGSMSLDQVAEASRRIAEVLAGCPDYAVVCVKSTVPPGTTENLVIPALERTGKKAGRDFGVCMSPEFLREGKAVYDFMHPDRIIIGEYDTRSGDFFQELCRDFSAPVCRTSLRSAEMIKLASNSFLAAKISFINEIGNICKNLDVDVREVARGMGLDKRIGPDFLNAGLGFGGSCLPKDLKALCASARDAAYEPSLLCAVHDQNEKQTRLFLSLLKKHVTLPGATVGVLGLAFKPGTEDIRDSRAIAVVRALLQAGASVKAYDPLAAAGFRKLFPEVAYASKEEVMGADAVLIITEWDEFRDLDYRGRVVIDGRGIERARQARVYEGICW
ncbi:MAG: UDP-glucose/GDP-mannose dehydrogenase family protein [Chloroflexi bacterium]|nr:UDP-glucose/GDP-mannose dehydrogenase family protein [Chloroflexota bacterium]